MEALNTRPQLLTAHAQHKGVSLLFIYTNTNVALKDK